MHRKWKKHLALLMTGSMMMLNAPAAVAQEAPAGPVQSGNEVPGPAPQENAPQANEAPAAPAPQEAAPQANDAPAAPAPQEAAPQANEAPAAPAPQENAPQANEAPAAPAPQQSAPQENTAPAAPAQQEAAPQANDAPAAPAYQEAAPQTNEAPAAPAYQESAPQANEAPAAPASQEAAPRTNEAPAAPAPQESAPQENAASTAPASSENTPQAAEAPAAADSQASTPQKNEDPAASETASPAAATAGTQKNALPSSGKAKKTAVSQLSDEEQDSVASAVRNEADDENNGTESNGSDGNGSESGNGNEGGNNNEGGSGNDQGTGNGDDQGNDSGKDGEGQTRSISKTISLEWEDDDNQDNVRPGSLTAILVAVTESGETEISRVDLKSENNWSATIDDVPTTDEDGNPITYQWKWMHETDNPDTASLPESLRDLLTSLPGYAKPTDTVTSDENGDETVRHYTHKSAYVNHNVTIKWDDDNDTNKLRPDHVTLTLPDGKTLTVYAKDNWTASIRLPVFKNGTRVEYEWTEEGITGYRLTLLEEDGSDYILTNTWTTVTKEKTVTKTETVTETKEVPVKKKVVKTVKPKQVKLTIQYWNDTTQAFDSYEAVYESGQKYNVVSPTMTGYSVSKSVVSGVIKSDTVINVKYKPKTYQVTIEYRFPDGTSAASSHTESVKTGGTFSVTSPQIQGYTADQATISGTVSGRNLSYVVYYSEDRQQNQEQQQQQEPQNQEQAEPAQAETQTQTAQTQETGAAALTQPAAAAASSSDLVDLADYETPLGLGGIAMNAGDCFE